LDTLASLYRLARPSFTPSLLTSPETPQPDPDRQVYRQYDVKSTFISLGQRPGLFVIDREGVVRYAYLGRQQWEIPTVDETLRQLDVLA